MGTWRRRMYYWLCNQGQKHQWGLEFSLSFLNILRRQEMATILKGWTALREEGRSSCFQAGLQYHQRKASLSDSENRLRQIRCFRDWPWVLGGAAKGGHTQSTVPELFVGAPATAADQESCCGGWSPSLSWPAGPHLSLTQNTAICIYIYYVLCIYVNVPFCCLFSLWVAVYKSLKAIHLLHTGSPPTEESQNHGQSFKQQSLRVLLVFCFTHSFKFLPWHSRVTRWYRFF